MSGMFPILIVQVRVSLMRPHPVPLSIFWLELLNGLKVKDFFN